jgi:hypothetical protein
LSVPTRRIVRAAATWPSGTLQDLYRLADDDGTQDVVLTGSPVRPWPPAADRQGAEPSLLAIAPLLGAATWVTHALGGWVPRGATPIRAVWWLVGVDALRLAMWLAIVAALAWWRPAGLGRGVRSAWALIPFGSVGAFAILGTDRVVARPADATA